jgi:hypothetical protein
VFLDEFPSVKREQAIAALELAREVVRPMRILLDEYQQNLTRLQIAVVVLAATSNRIEALKPLVPELLRALISIRPGQIVHVGA